MAIEADTGTPHVNSAQQSALENITVPDANLLFTGDFARAGHDLVLTGPDGTKLVLEGYFNTDTPPALVSPDGAMLTGDVVTSLAGPMFPAQYAQAAGANSGDVPIGQVQTMDGSASVVRANGLTLQLKIGDPVFQGDVVLTGPGSKLGVSFIDGTVFSMSADARMVLNSLIFDPDGSNNSMLFSLVEGTFIFASGQIAPTGDMKIQTPVATMGIRGTAPTVSINSLTGQVKFSIVPDPSNEHVGTYTLYSLSTGEAIGTVNSVGSSWQLTGADGTLTEIPKTGDDLLNDQNAINEITTVFTTAQSNANQQQPQGDPGDTTNSIPGAPPSGGLNTGQPGADGGNTPPPTNTPPPPEGDPAPPAPPPANTNNTDDPPPVTTAPDPAPAGPNVINGDAGDNVITGTPGVDIINGGGGADTINALGGNDTIIVEAGGGADNINAGDGNDTLIVSEDTGITYDGGAGVDTILLDGDLDIDTSTFSGDVEGIEIIDLNKTDVNVFTAQVDDFITPGTSNTLQFRGGAGDKLNISSAPLSDGNGGTIAGSWQQVQIVKVIDGLIFDVFEYVDAQGGVLGTAEVERGIILNIAPDVNVAGVPNTVDEDSSLVISGITVSDDNAGNAPIAMTLGVNNGALSLTSANGLTFSDNNGSDGTLAFTGTQAAITAAFASSIVYTPDSNFNGSDTLTITANDQADGPGSGLSDTETLGITVNPVDDPTLVMTFDGVSGSPKSYTETGMTVTSIFSQNSGHLHLGGNQILNHSGCCSTPYSFQLADGNAFDFVGFDVVSNSGSTLWTSDKGGSIAANSVGTHHEFALDPLFQGVTWVNWAEISGSTTIDNFSFADDPPVELVGTQGSDFIVGQDFAELLSGLGGDDTLVGRGGDDTLTGGTGADKFVFNSLQDGIDTITDFDVQNDVFDFTGLLDAVFNLPNDNIDDFVKATTDQQTGDTTVAVDVDGPGGSTPLTDLAILQGVGAGVDISVTVGNDDGHVNSAIVV